MTIYYLQDYKPKWSRELLPEGTLRDRRVFILDNVSRFLGMHWRPHYTNIKKFYREDAIVTFGVTARRQINATDWRVDVDIHYKPQASKATSKQESH